MINKNSNRIEFIDNEPFCRFDGTIMTPENHIKIFGEPGEVAIWDDRFCLTKDTIYSDNDFCDIVKYFGTSYGDAPEYDYIFCEGRYTHEQYLQEHLQNSVLIPLQSIEGIKHIKPFDDLKKDYPNFKYEKYIEFQDCLNEFYNNL